MGIGSHPLGGSLSLREVSVGFENTSTATLKIIRANLLLGLEKVAATIEDGSFHTVGPKGEAPPSQSGTLTLFLLQGIEAELEKRGIK
jgi:hypothetical protein